MQHRFIISGGGTGGHIFPAIAIANALREEQPDADILFVGALRRMEMERVPAAGYPIKGLPVSGFDRKNLFRNLQVLWNLLKSIRLARNIVKEFRPSVVIGVGGYASGPVLWAANSLGIPTVLQEQNSYAGITNKWLASKAARICVAYPHMDVFFPADKIILTGNPIRQELTLIPPKSKEAYAYFQFNSDKKTLLVVGGSLGARTINQSMIAGINTLAASGVQIIWQTGKFYYEDAKRLMDVFPQPNIVVTDFVSRMDYAYSIADLVVSRAGAGSISELCLLGKPAILVPSPNVAEDHQTKNAQALVQHKAAILIPDHQASELLLKEALSLLDNPEKLQQLSLNIRTLAQSNSAQRIAIEILNLKKGVVYE